MLSSTLAIRFSSAVFIRFFSERYGEDNILSIKIDKKPPVRLIRTGGFFMVNIPCSSDNKYFNEKMKFLFRIKVCECVLFRAFLNIKD